MAKRLFDIIASFLGIVILSPLMVLIACLIKRADGGTIFYKGERRGLYDQPFKMLKFRTMVEGAEMRGASSTSSDDVRITRIGRFLRTWKLDELPQLLNVLRGEMSIVGPRPQVKWAVDLYTVEERKVLTVRPGMTDYASLFFSNEEDLLRGSDNPDQEYMEKIHPRKMQLSLEYIEERNFFLDMKIIMLTLIKILKDRREAYEKT